MMNLFSPLQVTAAGPGYLTLQYSAEQAMSLPHRAPRLLALALAAWLPVVTSVQTLAAVPPVLLHTDFNSKQSLFFSL